MAELTRSNIAYNLSISPHRVKELYGESTLEYVFSSALYRKKFLERKEKNRVEIENSLTKRFGVQVNYPILSDIRLYTTIEKRGFLLVQDGVEVLCPDKIILDGERVTFKNCEE